MAGGLRGLAQRVPRIDAFLAISFRHFGDDSENAAMVISLRA